VLIDYLHVLCALNSPNETDPKLIIDADAVLSGSIARQRLQSVSGRHSKIADRLRPLKLLKLSPCNGLNVSEPLHSLATEQFLRIWAPARHNSHATSRNAAR